MNIKPLNQPQDFDQLTEWWLIEREKKGDYTALRILEKQYPQYASELGEWVAGFLEMESYPETELSPEEEARLNAMAEAGLQKCLAKLRADRNKVVIVENEKIKVCDLKNGSTEITIKKSGERMVVSNREVVAALLDLRRESNVTAYEHRHLN